MAETARGAMPSGTSTARSGPMRPMRARPIPKRGSIARATASRRSFATWVTRSWNRNGLVVGSQVTLANGTAERAAALSLIHSRRGRSGRRLTLGADKAYDVSDFVGALRARSVTPHIARNDHVTKTGKRRRTTIDARTLRHAGYTISQCCRKRIEEVFGWAKTQAGLAKTRFRGTRRVEASFTLALAAYNLIRLPKLMAAPS